MNQKGLILLGVLFFVSTATALDPAYQIKQRQWQTHSDSVLGVEFDYPKGWEIREFKRERAGTYQDRLSTNGPLYYTHLVIRELRDRHNAVGHEYEGNAIEIYSKAELLNPFYDFNNEVGSVDERELFGEFGHYVHDRRNDAYYQFKILAHNTVGNFRALYRDGDRMVGLRQFNCSAESKENQVKRAKQCLEIFLRVLNSLNFRAHS